MRLEYVHCVLVRQTNGHVWKNFSCVKFTMQDVAFIGMSSNTFYIYLISISYTKSIKLIHFLKSKRTTLTYKLNRSNTFKILNATHLNRYIYRYLLNPYSYVNNIPTKKLTSLYSKNNTTVLVYVMPKL